ncbi:ATP-dependent DNA helicase PIF1-like [Senna tora]|uniref:ATP-dependent DNA helicase PIF1-like n=1 Tax=Senna tora TaxID=362788 RepID=A0A834SQ89_9FABA|nr:ATP-dependent DNA helicase PIF1-like [Senna tora]
MDSKNLRHKNKQHLSPLKSVSSNKRFKCKPVDDEARLPSIPQFSRPPILSDITNVYTTEFLNTISGSGLPYHQLKLKVGAPIMLLCNIDRSMGLCNGTILIITRICDHVIEESIMSGKFAGEKILIARMLISHSDSKLPFKFQRHQFPVVLSFAMTINKSQGQTLSNGAAAEEDELVPIDDGIAPW